MRCLLLILLLSASPAVQADELKVLVVRHAEKAADATRDPSLSPIGQSRARALAQLLREKPLVAIYATQYRRTQLTAAPLAHALKLPITVRPAGETAASLAALIRSKHRQGAVLVVGHSNTVPALVEALSGQVVPALGDDQYDRYFIVTLPTQGPARLEAGQWPATATLRSPY